VRLEGSIDAFSLPDIFSLLSMTKKTGGLHLRRDAAHGVVWFTTGAVTGGASDIRRQSLARRLVGTGHVDDDALQAAIDRADEDGVGVARALQLGGGVDEAILHEVGEEHVVDTVFDLLRWNDGDFEFVVDEANPDDVGVSRQVDDLVTEARRRLELWGTVATVVPSPQTVLSIAANPAEDPDLSREDWSLLALVDGRRTVAEIVALSGRGDFAVVSSVADLVTRGFLTTEDDTVAALLRRHELLSSVEPAADPAPVQVPTQVTSPPAEPARRTAEPAAAPARQQPRVAAVPQAAGRRDITPSRPEPFLPPRQPDHPDDAPAVAAVGGGAALAPAAAALIERDPSVNKSLLLRLIAGVRGL
jgi:hypothetical protein